MHPYRPLHVAREDDSACPARELRGLAVVLVVLGVLRLLPALAASEPFGAETVVAVVLLASGLVELCAIRRWWARGRRSRGFSCS